MPVKTGTGLLYSFYHDKRNGSLGQRGLAQRPD